MSRRHGVASGIGSEEGVYGLIVVSGVIATAGGAHPDALFTLLFTAVTVIVFWAAHVYAGAVAMHGSSDADGAVHGLRASIRHAMGRSWGMLAASALPAAVLLLGPLGALDDATAIWLSLWAIVAALAVMGYLAYRRRGAAWHWRLLGAAATASFGVVIIVAKILISH